MTHSEVGETGWVAILVSKQNQGTPRLCARYRCCNIWQRVALESRSYRRMMDICQLKPPFIGGGIWIKVDKVIRLPEHAIA
jgi:hypothetical protein